MNILKILPALLLLALILTGCDTLGDFSSRSPGTAGDPYGIVTVNGGVQLIRNGEVVRTIRTAEPRVEKWAFTDHGRALVVKSSGGGPAIVELFDPAKGTAREKIPASQIKDGQPAWAAGFGN